MRPVHALVLTVLCGASFGLGLVASKAPSSPLVSALRAAPSPDNPWREDLSALRGTAEGEVLRAIALDGIQAAHGRYALHESVTLLGWVGDERDIQLILGILHEEEVDDAAIAALGRLGAVEELIALSEHPEHRMGSLVGLGLTGDDAALPILVEALEVMDLRDNAAHALALHGSEAAEQALIAAFPGADSWHIGAVGNALASFPEGSPARLLLQEQLTRGDGPHQIAAMNALVSARDPGMYDTLLLAVQEGSPAQRAAAISAMGTLDDPRLIPILVEVAQQGRRTEIWPAVWSLSAMTDPDAEAALQGLVESGNEEVASYAAGALAPEKHEQSIETLFWAMEHRGSRTRQAARDRLFAAPWTDCPREVLDLALEELASPSPGSWTGNAWTLVLRHGDKKAHAEVERLLLEGDNSNRAEALWALQGQPGLLPDSLALKLLDDEDANVRRAALGLLEARGDGAALDLERELIKRLDSEDRQGWDGLEDTLARIGGPAAVDALLTKVAGGTVNESSVALSALVNAGDPEHLDRLRSLYEGSEDPDLRRRVLEGVLWSGTPGAEGFAYAALESEEDPGIRANAVSALGSAGTPEALKTLDGLLDDEDPQVRSAALGALADQPGMRPRLIEALDDPDLANTALSSLQNDRSPEAREAVEGIALDPDADIQLRTSAIYGMGWNGGDPAVLGVALQDEEPSVQQAALSALESRGNTESAEYIAMLLDSEDEALAQQAAWSLQRMGGRVFEDNTDRIEELTGGDTGYAPGGYYDQELIIGDWGGPYISPEYYLGDNEEDWPDEFDDIEDLEDDEEWDPSWDTGFEF